MTHNILDDKFIAHRSPAWHRIGKTTQSSLTAREAWEEIGPYQVEKRQLSIDGLGEIDRYAIIGYDEQDPTDFKLFGVAGESYELVTPTDIVDIWDEHVKLPIETMGALGSGERLFITAKLDKYGVMGDEVQDYILAYLAMTGFEANRVADTPVRIVCQNTLVTGLARASMQLSIRHEADVHAQLAEWMSEIVQGQKARTDALREVFEVLAGMQLKPQQVKDDLKLIYPDPKPLRANLPDKIKEQRMPTWEANLKWAERTREKVFSLMETGTGVEHPAMRGTGWGLYNVVVEYEDYRPGREGSSAESAIFGERASYKTRALTVLQDRASRKRSTVTA